MTHVRMWLSGSVMLALGIWYLGGVSSAADDDLAKAVLKLADAVEKKSANAKKDAEALAGKHDNEAIMELLKLRKKGGLGLGGKAGAVNPDGIEQKILALDKKPLPAKQIAEEAPALVKAGYIILAIGDMLDGKVPPKEKKKEKLWKTDNEEMKKAAQDLIDAFKDDKPNPAKVHKASQRLNNSCIKCHDDFR